MNKYKHLLLLILILGLALACQSIYTPVEKSTRGDNLLTQVVNPDQQNILPVQTTNAPGSGFSPTSSITIIPENTSTFTATSLFPTLTPSATGLPGELQIKIFEELWTIIYQEYLYSDFNGVDWMAIYQDYSERLSIEMTSDEFYHLMDEMVSSLGDDHSKFLTPQEVEMEDAEYRGNLDYVGIGILVSAIPERDRVVIVAVFPGSPADKRGLKPRDSIIAVEGQPILDPQGNLLDSIRGPEGSYVSLLVQSPGENPRRVTLSRERVNGTIPVPYSLLESSGGARIGYILLVTFTDGTIDDKLRKALLELTESAPLDGLILDNRQNSGGADTVMTPILSYFTFGTMGYFINREDKYPLVIDRGEDINGSLNVPLVVLIGRDTVSFGEVFAGILKDSNRAYIIGETTEGNIETLWGYDFADGSRAWIAHDTFIPYNNPQEDWELTGIVPDLVVEGNWEEYTMTNDPAILAGLDYLNELSAGYSDKE